MTQEQITKLDELMWAITSVVREANGAYLPYELAAAIARADDARGECLFVSTLSASPQPTEKP